MTKGYLIIGDGGHARVVQAALISIQCKVIALLGKDDLFLNSPNEAFLAIGIGMSAHKPILDLVKRGTLAQEYIDKGYSFPNIQYHSAIVAPDVHMGIGVQLMAGAVIQCGTKISSHAIINTRASVDHDCSIATAAHICPGAVLCGGVRVGKAAMVGAGAVVLPGLEIGDYAIVGAGAVITKDVPVEGKAIGVW